MEHFCYQNIYQYAQFIGWENKTFGLHKYKLRQHVQTEKTKNNGDFVIVKLDTRFFSWRKEK